MSRPTNRSAPVWIGLGVASAALFGSAASSAAPRWVDRGLTLPHGDFAFDVGLGLGHAPFGRLGPGFNLELAVGIVRHLELGVRTGLRFDDAARSASADAYGRMFDTETYGQGWDTVANPEIRVRGQLVDGRVFELALEGRAYLPFNTGFGMLFGVPIAFHFGEVARLDTGVYVPILFYSPTQTVVSFPAHLWFQISHALWLGPLLGVRIYQGDHTVFPLGFGLGYQVTRYLDFKTQLLFPMLDSHGAHEAWGLGAGIQVRIE
jgi:hypothetical protein